MASKDAKKVLTYCQECHMKCALRATVEAGKITRISGATCEKGRFVTEKIYNPERLGTALRRVGERGEGRWEAISVEQALDESAERLADIKAKHGPEAVATLSPSFHREISGIAPYLLAQLLNTPNVISANHLCVLPDAIAQIATFGDMLTMEGGLDARNSRLLLLWGVSLWEARPRVYNEVALARSKGAKVIVVDPRPTKEAVEADLWLRVRPGADGALALAFAHVIIKEGLYDRDFVRDWTFGFDRLAAHVREWTPERVAKITWVPEEQIVKAARLLATIKPAAVHTRAGTGSKQANSTQTSRAIAILSALANTIDVKGGNLLSHGYGGFRTMLGLSGALRARADIEAKRLGAKEYPLLAGPQPPAGAGPRSEAYNLTASRYYHAHTHYGYQAMLDGDLKALASFGSNVVVNDLDGRRIVEALKSLDFFVAVDLFLNPTADFADIVLPVAHWLEAEAPLNNWCIPSQPVVFATRKVVEPPDGLLEDRTIAIELARRAGEPSPWTSARELDDWRLEPLGLDLRQLQELPGQRLRFPRRHRTYRKNGFATISGKVELYSNVFEKLRYDPLPTHQEPPESPLATRETAQEYPLVLTDYRLRYYTHAEQRNSPSLRKLAPDPELQINPETARELGIEDGDWAYVETTPSLNPESRKVKVRAKYTPEIDPRVVAAVVHWWYPEKQDFESRAYAANINAIMSQNPPYDPICGVPQVRAILCRVSKVPVSDQVGGAPTDRDRLVAVES